MSELTVRPVRGIGEVTEGADLAALIAGAAPWLADGDVLVVTSKIVSKAEGRLVAVPPDEGPARAAARDAVLDAQTVRPVARRGATRIVQTHHGLVLAAAGIDASNVDRGHLVLLPVDPDASARALRAALRERYGLDVAVIISDTMGRPWRLGLTDVAIGAAGIGALRDHRGEPDAHGNALELTQVAVVDELAGAGELVKGKADQVPVAVIRGYRITSSSAADHGARALVRPAAEDMFSMGTAEAYAEGLRAAATLGDAVSFADVPLPAGALDRALSTVEVKVETLREAWMRSTGAPLPPYSQAFLRHGGDPRTPGRAGADLQRLRAALAAEGLASIWIDVAAVPEGVLAVGMPA
jgi:coenzyme F420-0:L-glutamate ligase / coenzyme F420-1:gamma-L-glutamate ligase